MKTLFVVLASSILLACSGADPVEQDTSFEITVSETEFQLQANSTYNLSYQITQSVEQSISATLQTSPTNGEVNVDESNNTIVYVAGEELGSGSFTLVFDNNGDKTVEVSFQYTVVSSMDTTEPDEEVEPPVVVTESPYYIYFPTDYVTIYEEESFSIQINRNYTSEDDVTESFYFNTASVQAKLSADGSQIDLKALFSDEDTYGEIVAVTEYEGVKNESRMQLIYFNKNRDLQTEEPPVIALLNQEIDIPLYRTSIKTFGVYDPDSDRISYRVLSAPQSVKTHVNRSAVGYELTIHSIAPLDPNDNVIHLQVSDAHHVDDFEFLLTQTDVSTTENQPPELFIEEQVTLSLVQHVSDLDEQLSLTLAFVAQDKDEDELNYSVRSNNSSYEIDISYPYILVNNADITNLQHDQLTLSVDDGNYQSKLTFHIYQQDNYVEFLGGNPNTAPLIEVANTLDVLETKTVPLAYQSRDFEEHEFDVTLEYDDSLILAEIINEQEISVTALQPDVETNTTLVICLEDVFESAREQEVDVRIYKNTEPVIEVENTSINMVEGTIVYSDLALIDPDESGLIPQFTYDDTLLEVNYIDGIMSVRALDVDEDTQDQIIVEVTDEFGLQDRLIIPIIVRFLNPDNAPPTITFSQAAFNILPGEAGSLTVTIADPDSDPLQIEHIASSELLTYDYTRATGLLEFRLDASSPFDVDYQITFTVSDGIHLVDLPIDVRVATAPEAPVLNVQPYAETVNEEASFIVNFTVTDFNNDEITMSTLNLHPDINVTFFDGYMEVHAPEDIPIETTYSFTLVATDETLFSSSTDINFTAIPVNDIPYLVLTDADIVLTNDDIYALEYTIEDPDSGSHVVTVESPSQVVSSVNPGLSTIFLSGLQKGATGTYGIEITVQDATAYSDQSVEVEIILQNDPATIEFVGFGDKVPWLEIEEQSTRDIGLTITDPDGDTRTDANGDTLSITCTSTSTNLVIESCELSNIEISTGDIAEDEDDVSITINVNDGFDQTTVQFKANIEAL